MCRLALTYAMIAAACFTAGAAFYLIFAADRGLYPS